MSALEEGEWEEEPEGTYAEEAGGPSLHVGVATAALEVYYDVFIVALQGVRTAAVPVFSREDGMLMAFPYRPGIPLDRLVSMYL